jgi:hypothetical protein
MLKNAVPIYRIDLKGTIGNGTRGTGKCTITFTIELSICSTYM